MIAVIFEVQVAEGKTSEYLDIANELRPLFSEIEGFISIERFQSLSNEGKVLSLSFWRDENAIQEWRRLEGHRLAQSKGRNGVFESYRLRVASVLRDYGMDERSEAPQDSVDVHG
ncbi:antibiotic biosynthesis monooxygenase [Vibrio europaeus]|uniref:Antibiotic biosynthesis monooxygenase n=1 Tax=Vibrio europaeus TaxID=300876 RepID=A0A178J8Y7_9VIBR|nr:antibiotic biosynthesis monooxygenase [Vibrio europaeus]MDC5705351.1 antibiotic biosynthesis monooxygenase [Vibrio europaeus]MDC5710630.1 antibiotic biosynthesis monooxygenase [Vibrio europaeus]MDC5715720.1 antibiotic biosynthesis monooxygenase [Vibrio europaeus]MDC5719881.1 antibiotic biosynthesis monooxygenase [Vibrio europaeus]MDC5724231.1 antibiotic biosynthesis monooxygenase [Vibrio europaeus]